MNNCSTPVYALTHNEAFSQNDVQQLCSQGLFTMSSVSTAPNCVLEPLFKNPAKTALIRSDAKAYLSSGRLQPSFIPTGSPNLDEILGGGLAVGSITELTGAQKVGKSMFCTQLCVSLQIDNDPASRALYLTTDNSFKSSKSGYICERFDSSLDEVSGKIDVGYVFNSDVLLKSLQTAASNFQNRKYKLIVLDSVTGLFKNNISRLMETQLRQPLFQEITGALYTLSKLYNAAVLIVRETDGNGLPDMDEDILPWKSLVPFVESQSYSLVYINRIIFEKTATNFQVSRVPTFFHPTTSPPLPYMISDWGIHCNVATVDQMGWF